MLSELIEVVFSSNSFSRDRFLAATMLLILSFLAVLILGLIFYVVDRISSKEKTVSTTVRRKEVIPAHTTTSFVMVGKVTVPVTTFHEEAYRLYFDIETKGNSIDVESEYFQNVRNGDGLEVVYQVGGLSRAHYPTKVISR